MTEKPHPGDIRWSQVSWAGNRREQMERWASMSLDDIVEAQDEMAETTADLERQARAELQGGSSSRVADQAAPYGGAGDGRSDLRLSGCTPEPLMAYLSALGVLRLVGQQKDSGARGWWDRDEFLLRSTLDREGLIRFFLEEYVPTPIVGAWAGGTGFFGKDNKKAVEALVGTDVPRVHLYGRVIEQIRDIIKQEGVEEKPGKEDKPRLLRRYRAELPDPVVEWMDAVMALQQDGQSFAPVLGTGGNDGRLDFTQNFMQRLVALGLHTDDPPAPESRAMLDQALFGTPALLDKGSVGQFAPGRSGGPNATQGMEGDSLDNAWQFILMIEGSLLLAGAAARRFGVVGGGGSTFPFTVRPVGAGFSSASRDDEADSRGELWLPIWNRPVRTEELHQMFGEGRAEVGGRPARDGKDFARAVAGLGVDRGIAGFNRVVFLKRSGKAYLAAPAGRFAVVERSGVDLLREADACVDRFRRAGDATEAPPRVAATARRIDTAVFEFCKYGGTPAFQRILVSLGRAERALAVSERFREAKKLRPLAGLSPAWIEAADDGSPEFAIARALAAMDDPAGKIGPLRTNLELVEAHRTASGRSVASWAEKDRCVVWRSSSLPANLTRVLERRLMDGERRGCERLPLDSRFTVSLSMVSKFLYGTLDDARIEALLWGLILVDPSRRRRSSPGGDPSAPRSYALLKLLFHPHPFVVERSPSGRPVARPLRAGEEGGIVIRPEPAVLSLLRGGRVGEACILAVRRLRASGLDPMPRAIRGRGVRADAWRELDSMGRAAVDPLRLAASLLLPIRMAAVTRLVHLVTRGDDREESEAETAPDPELEGGTLR